jgi:imidazoleglycerol phosphate dehydratase HisB
MRATLKRETLETCVEVSLDPEGSGQSEADTGVLLLDCVLRCLAEASGFDLRVRARGDLETGDHHTVEDVGITLGCVLAQAIEKGIASSIVPSGQCLAQVAVSFGLAEYSQGFQLEAEELDGMELENFGHFLRALAYNGCFTLHVRAEGGSDRQKIEAVDLALGRALKKAFLDGSLKK